MAFIPVADTVLCVARFALGTEEWTNTLWFHRPNFTPAEQDTICDVVDQYWGGALKAGMSNQASYLDTTCYDMNSDTGRIVVNNDTAGIGGTTGESLPLNVAMCLTMYTAWRGKSGRGRVYVGGGVEAQLSNGAWVAATVNDRLAKLQAVGTSASAAGWTHVIVSRYTDGAPRVQGVVNPVTEYASRSLKATTQRRRLDRP